MTMPCAVIANDNNEILDLPGLGACGASGLTVTPLLPKELIPLPEGSDLFFLPDRKPVAFDPASGKVTTLEDGRPVAAFLPPGYTNLRSAAYQEGRKVSLLPLFAYAPVAWYKNKLHVPAIRIDARKVHDTRCTNKAELNKGLRHFAKTQNRLIRHLAQCAQVNGCPNAINLFLGRYEAPLPTSPACNANCLGCISFQPKGSCPATQPRLTFVPTPDEIAEIALHHLENVKNGIVSFGQGCEGEPLLQAKVIAQAIQMIREKTRRGTIHMNTNAGLWKAVDMLCEVGLDSIRVSLNSARADFYERYYAPHGYQFADVCRSIQVVKTRGKFVSLNYLVMPGFTDQTKEFEALTALLQKCPPDMIQWRNLNYDPQAYFRFIKTSAKEPLLGMRTMIDRIKNNFPQIRHGYFNIPQ